MSLNEIVQTFKNALEQKTVGKSVRNKLKKLIKYIADEEFKRSTAYKNIAFEIRKDIKYISLKMDIDYR